MIETKTKDIMKLTTLLLLITAAGAVRMRAATTNLVQNINFELTFCAQGPTNHPAANTTVVTVNRFRVTTKDIIAALGQATTNDFSAAARLVSVRDATSTNTLRKIEVRDGSNRVDVTSYFRLTPNVSSVASVHSLQYNSATGISTGIRYGIFSLAMTNANMTANLDLTGFATTTHASLKEGNVVLGVDDIDAAVAGSGTSSNGMPAVVTGLIGIEGRLLKVE